MTDEQKELNRQIAERLGWTLHRIADRRHSLDRKWHWINKSGTRVTPTRIYEDSAMSDLPNWAGSVDKALELLAGQRFSLNYSPDGHSAYDKEQRQCQWECQIVEYTQSLGAAVADTAAEAICRAFLEWKGHNDGT